MGTEKVSIPICFSALMSNLGGLCLSGPTPEVGKEWWEEHGLRSQIDLWLKFVPVILYQCDVCLHDPIYNELPRLVSSEESTCQCRSCKKLRFLAWVRKIPWSWKWQPTPVFLPRKFCVQRSLGSYCLWVHKKSDMT